jgi:DNA helicase-2/ATP-dependent DNA helicase PcrA
MSAPPASLNPAQRAAVRHVDGPLLVLAGPGSGKTRVVTHRIAHLLRHGVAARNILAVTFTNKAAREMRDRVRKLVGKGARDLTLATFHSTCARILRQEIEALGYGKNFSIYDESSQESLVRLILRDLKGLEGAPSPSAFMAEMSLARSAVAGAGAGPVVPAVGPAVGVDEPEVESPAAPAPPVPPDARAALVAAASDRYRDELKARNAVDFDDLIDLTVRLFREHKPALERWRERYRYLLVDEYQDTNRSQEEVLELLAGERKNLCVVGDDDQSIYGWRGAEVEHILRFSRRYPGAAVVRLEENYRSTRAIVAAATSVIGRNRHRHAKDLFTSRDPGAAVRLVELPNDEEEAEFIAREVRDAVEAKGGDPWVAASPFAILFRTNEQMRPIEQALRKYKVPYRLLGGRSFFDRKEVLDVMGYLRLAMNRKDEEALLRVINVPSRGIGARAIEALRGAAVSGEPTFVVLASVAAGGVAPEGLSPSAAAAVQDFVGVVEQVKSAGESRSRTLVTDLLRAIDYQAEVDRTYKDANVRLARMAVAGEMQQAWEAHLTESVKGGLGEFLEDIMLQARDDDAGGGGVTLATVHASKGLEFPCVYVAGLEEGFFPHRRSVEDGRALEEERRLFYVAITRAMDRLTLTRAKVRTVRAREVKTMPSRFLAELTPAAPEPGIVDTAMSAPAIERHDPDAVRAKPTIAGHLERMRALLGSDKGG